jgi:hypothetical protein
LPRCFCWAGSASGMSISGCRRARPISCFCCLPPSGSIGSSWHY